MADAVPSQSGKEAEPKIKQTQGGTHEVLSESQNVVVMRIRHKKYRGEIIPDTIRKDHQYDANQRPRAGRTL